MSIETVVRCAVTTLTVATATGCAAVVLAGPASAGPLVLDEYIEVPKCEPLGDSNQGCAQVVYRQAYIDSPSVKVEFTASSDHCSSILARVFVDGREWGSNIVGPGQSDGGYEIPLDRKGLHKFGVQAEGITGGCNTGRISSWAGTLHIEELPA